MVMNEISRQDINLTTKASQAIQELLEKRGLPGYALRVFVSGGGCSGMQYGMAFEGAVRTEDSTYECNGIKIVVDEVSINYLRGITVDYEDNLMGGGFKIHNPNAVSSCGCGQSFKSKNGEDARTQPRDCSNCN